MGNEQSQLSGLELEEKAVEVTDFWSHHSATVNSGNITNLSVFVGEPLVGGSLWVSQTPLEKASKNLMIHRHPCILKYISSWHKGSKFYLAVEDVKPLPHVLPTQNTLQICIGLHAILKSISFLHEKALSSHNNICTASIYVTKDGNWKLGGMEYLCRFKDMTTEYMSKTRVHRYDKAIDPNEEKNITNACNRKDCVDIYAFSVLAKEVLKNKTDDDVPVLPIFKDLCKTDLQNENIASRSTLSKLLEHPFFSHEFISIHSFLTELPLKSDVEKAEFFTNLRKNLRKFDDKVVGSQLGGLLLSRMVLLNKTAQSDLLPYVLCPRDQEPTEDNGLFTIDTFKQFLTPKLLEIFCVRDAQIRLLLLNHFAHFMNCFSREELQSHILPELLVGIKDTNDHLVAVTLRALADLVSILGSATVIGGKRAKLFNDGRPITHTSGRRSRRNSRRGADLTSSSEHTPPLVPEDFSNSTVSIIERNQILELPERPSPDGEEGETSTEELEPTAEDDLDNWEDWDINEEVSANVNVNVEASTSGSNFVQSEINPIISDSLDLGLHLSINNLEGFESTREENINVQYSNEELNINRMDDASLVGQNLTGQSSNGENRQNSNGQNTNRQNSNGENTNRQNSNVQNSNGLNFNRPNSNGQNSAGQNSNQNVLQTSNINRNSTQPLNLRQDSNGINKKSLPDISELDIKNQRNRESIDFDNFNFFHDMEPVIETATKYLIPEDEIGYTNFGPKDSLSKSIDLSVKGSENHEEGWGEDLDW